MVPQMPHWFDFIHLRSRQDLPHLGLVILLVLGVGIGVYLSLQPQLFNKRASESSLVELSFVPASLQIQSGRIYEAKIAIDPKGQRVTAAQLELQYDPTAVTMLDSKNEGFLPVTLKTQDSFKGDLEIIYGSTIESQPTQPGIVATIKFKTLTGEASTISIKGNSQISVSSQEGNVLTQYPVLKLDPGVAASVNEGREDTTYPNSLLNEKAFFPAGSPFLRDFRNASEPQPEIKPERVKPGFNGTYIKQLGKDIFIDPIIALNQVIEEKATDLINK